MLREVLLLVVVVVSITFALESFYFDSNNISSRFLLSIPLQHAANTSFETSTTDFVVQVPRSEETNNAQNKDENISKNLSSPTEHKQCIEHRNFLFNTDDIQKSVKAYNDFRQILPLFIENEHLEYPTLRTNRNNAGEQEYDYSHDRFNLLGPVGPMCKLPLEKYGGGDLEKRACGLQRLQHSTLFSGVCVVFSVGGNNLWDFEQNVAQSTDCKIHTFDCTVDGVIPENIKSRTTFHKVCLGDKDETTIDGKTFLSWRSLLSAVNLSSSPTYLKIDIEGYEIPVMRSIIDCGKDLPLQIAMELHLTKMSDNYVRMRSSAEIMAFMNYIYDFGGYMMIDRNDNIFCPHCSELLLVRVDCTRGNEEFIASRSPLFENAARQPAKFNIALQKLKNRVKGHDKTAHSLKNEHPDMSSITSALGKLLVAPEDHLAHLQDEDVILTQLSEFCPRSSLSYLSPFISGETANLSIGIADVPSYLVSPCINHLKTVDWMKDDQAEYFMELYVYQLIQLSTKLGVRVERLDAASSKTYDFYYVPYFPFCNTYGVHVKDQNLLWEWIHEQPFFKLSKLRGQVSPIITTVGTTFMITLGDKLIQHMGMLTHELYSTDKHDPNFTSAWDQQDISIPYPSKDYENMPLNGRRDRDFFFVGTIDRFGPRVRRYLVRLMASDPNSVVKGPGEGYLQYTLTTKMCFVPRGDRHTTKHLFNFISAGCIPIIISDGWHQLPFAVYLNYERFTYLIPKSIVLSDDERLFRERIEYIRRDFLGQASRKKVLLQVRRFFVYGKGSPLTNEFKPSYCMLILILQNLIELKEKRHNWQRSHNDIVRVESDTLEMMSLKSFAAHTNTIRLRSINRSNYSLTQVNTTCPKFLFCKSLGDQGLGDHFQRWVHCAYMSKLLQATLVINYDDFSKSPSFHVGARDYQQIASILGFKRALSISDVKHEYHPMDFALNVPKVLENYNVIDDSELSIPCGSVVSTSNEDCTDLGWCTFSAEHNFIGEISPYIRNSSSRAYCIDHNLGFVSHTEVLNVVIHVRTGDVCIHCNDVEYYKRVFHTIELGNYARIPTKVHFISQKALPRLQHYFPQGTFWASRSVIKDVCAILTSDIVVNTGSSFPTIVAVSETPYWPLVFEDVKKEYRRLSKQRSHDCPLKECIWISNGISIISEKGIQDRMRKMYDTKNSS